MEIQNHVTNFAQEIHEKFGFEAYAPAVNEDNYCLKCKILTQLMLKIQ